MLPAMLCIKSLFKLAMCNKYGKMTARRLNLSRPAFRFTALTRGYSQKTEAFYSDADKEKILKIVNDSSEEILSRFQISKPRIKMILNHRASNGPLESLSEVEFVDGFTERVAHKLFNSIVAEGTETSIKPQKLLKIKGQILYPNLSSELLESAKRVVSLHATPSCISWSCLEPAGCTLRAWDFHSVPEHGNKLMSDTLHTAWRAVQAVPRGCLYVLEAPPTSLRAPGGDPANPRVLTVNLQSAQLVSAIVAMLAARSQQSDEDVPSGGKEEEFRNVVYFLRPSLASRLFSTLVGSERVCSESTVRELFNKRDVVTVPAELQTYFKSQSVLSREVLGQCLLINLAFMRLCFTKNHIS